MNIRFYHRLWLVLTTIILSVSTVQAQMSSEFWINVKDDIDAYNNFTMFFGNHINATYGIDSLNSTIQECRCVPLSDFMVFWTNIPGRVNTWNVGLFMYDFRGIPTNISKQDTFVLSFFNYFDTADFTIRWPKREYLAQRCDSMFLVDPTGQIPKINMFDIDSLLIQDALIKSIYKLRIYKYGCNIIDAVQSEFSFIPTDFSLHQNYPNPFNPTTTIEYQLSFTSRVIIKVYNLLGQNISTLTDEIQQAGFKSVTWNANDAASGVYFYKLEAVSVSDPFKSFTQMKKMVLVR